jgi:hypothetical protein
MKLLPDNTLNFRAESAAMINSQANKLAPKVCAIFARSSQDWRQNVIKVWGIFFLTAHPPSTHAYLSHWQARIPEILRGNTQGCEQSRLAYIPLAAKNQVCRGSLTDQQIQHLDASKVPRIGPLVPRNERNQMLIPESLNPKLTATCFDVDSKGNIQNTGPAIPTVSCKIPLR